MNLICEDDGEMGSKSIEMHNSLEGKEEEEKTTKRIVHHFTTAQKDSF